ncbi:hypothetical protein [Maricaulis sp.]|uniref:hypothetical protein n=1 Tax=Maricaulis sp. TaxID=1486257 RepID=UPI003A911BF0
MFGAKVVEVSGRLVATGAYSQENAKLIYDYLDFETDNGRFKTGKVVVATNIGKHIEIGEEGIFVFTRFLGRALAMVITSDNVEVNPMFRGFSFLHLLWPLALFLIGLFFAPLWLVTAPIWAFAAYFLVLPHLVGGKLKAIARKHGVDWKTARKTVNF